MRALIVFDQTRALTHAIADENRIKSNIWKSFLRVADGEIFHYYWGMYSKYVAFQIHHTKKKEEKQRKLV